MWTTEEMDVIKSNPELSNGELKELLAHKTISQIKYKRSLLGIKSPRKYPARRIKCKIGDTKGFLTLEEICDNKGVFSCDCKNEKCKGVTTYSIKDVFGKKNHCTSCGAYKIAMFDDYKEIKGITWARIIYSAKYRNIDFDLTIEDAWDLFIKQDRKCVLSGYLIGFEYDTYKGKENRKLSCTASLDRIDPKLGYTKRNCQWLHKEINHLKNKWPQNKFIKICNDITKYQQESLSEEY